MDSSTLIWQNQIQSSKYIKGVKTCEGNQNWNVPTNPACSDGNGICSFGGAGRTTTIQTGSSKQVLNVLSGAAGSASEVYSSERIILQKAGKEACGVPGTTPITTTTTDNCGNTTTTTTNNTYITLPACYCENTNGPTGPRYNVIGQNPGLAQWAARVGATGGSAEKIDAAVLDSQGNIIVVGRTTGSSTGMNLVISNFSSVSGGAVVLSTYAQIQLASQNSIFVVKYNPSGQAQWVTMVNNIVSGDDNSSFITVDSCDNIYVGSSTFPRGGGNSITIRNANTTNPGGGTIVLTTYATVPITTTNDMFIVKYNSQGQAQAVTKINTATQIVPPPAPLAFEQSFIKGISAGPDGIYVTGWSEASTNYPVIMVYNSTAPVAGVVTPSPWGFIDPSVAIPSRETIIAKFDFNLQAQWATYVGNVGGAQEAITLVADKVGNVYLAVNQGSVLSATINVLNFVSASGGGTQIQTSQYGNIFIGGNSTLLVKYNTSGQVQAAAEIRGTGFNGLVFISSMSVDTQNNLCVTGYFQSTTATIRNFAGVAAGVIQQTDFGRITNSNSGTFDALVIKYNSNLQGLWATALGATLAARDEGTNIAIDASNNIYITGTYQANPLRINSFASITPGSPPIINVSPTIQLALEGVTSLYLIKYNSSGVAQWATRQGQTNLTSQTRNPILVDSNYNIYMAGPFNNTTMNIYNYNSLNTGTTPPTVNLSLYASLARQSSATDSFIIKYEQAPILQEIPLPINNQSNPYLPPFDTYYAMKNPICNYPVQDQNQKHFVKECHTRFPNANNGASAACEPCDNNMYLNPVTKQFETNPYTLINLDGTLSLIPATCDGCILENGIYVPPYCIFCEWATYLSGTSSTAEQEVARDSAGNVYVTGYYSSTIPVIVKNAYGPTQTNSNITLPTSSTLTVFVIKYSSAGIALWATYLNGTSNDIGYSVAVDANDNVIIAGQYSTTGTAIPVTQWDSATQAIVNSAISLPATNSISSYIIKYSSVGTAIWAGRLDGTTVDNDVIQYIITDSNNDIYITGSYYTITGVLQIFNGATSGTPITTTISLPPPGTAGASMFLIKYNSSGVAQWATYIAGSGTTSLSDGRSIAIDSSFNIYVTGLYRSTTAVTVYNGTTSTTAPVSSGITLLSSSSGAIFVIKYTPSGNNIIASLATLIDSPGSIIDGGQSIAIDSSGSVVITGYYTGVPSIYNASGNTQAASTVTLQYPTIGNTLAFIVKYSTALQAIWATYLKSVTGTSQGNSIAAGPDGYIYVTGQYTNNVTLMNAAANSQTESMVTFPGPGYTQMYIVKYDLNGQAVCATYIQTGTTSTIGQSVTLDRNNNIFVSGQYAATAPVVIYNVFKTGVTIKSAVSLPASSTISAFLIKYTQD